MKRWSLVFCLICLSGALSGAMLIQNLLVRASEPYVPVRSYQPANWAKQLELREEEYAVHAAVIDSEILRGNDLLTRVKRYEIINETDGYMPEWLGVDESLGVHTAALADAVAQNQTTSLLTQAPKTRLPSRLVSRSESKARDSDGEIASMRFSRVGFDEAMIDAVLHVAVDVGISRGHFVSLRKVNGRWIGHRTIRTWME